MTSSLTLHRFHGGIHPPENKQQSTQTAIQSCPLPSQLWLPVQQHIGAPARVIVSVGERVLKGQVLAVAQGALSSPLHAPTSGVVRAIHERAVAHPSGLPDLCIELDVDGLEEWLDHPSLYQQQGVQRLQDIEKSALLEHLRQSGIVGLGGAGFPTAIKTDVGERNIDTLIINGAECEPYITADDMLMRERAACIIEGVRIVQHLIQAKQCLIAIEDNKPEAIAAMEQALAEVTLANTHVVSIPTRYPSGGEKQLIRILTGLEVPSGQIPASIGVVCQNVGTVEAIYRAVALGEPLISRITTLTGNSISRPGNYEVLIGTPLRHLLNHAGYQASSLERVIYGGPMMGFTLLDLDVGLSKTGNCLLAPTEDELPLNDIASACIRCGLCAESCPAELLPQQLYWFAKGDQFDKAEQHNLFDCIECGVCSYVCPSQIPLVQYYRYAKGSIREQRAAHEKSEQARLRFEARIERQERDAAEKEAKRKARAEAAALAQQQAAQAAASNPTSTVQTPAKEEESPLELLRRKVIAQQDRVNKMQAHHDLALSQGADTVAALAQGVEKQREKLLQLQQELSAAEAAASQEA